MSGQALLPSKCDDCGVSIRNHGMAFEHKVYGHTRYVCVKCSIHYMGLEWRLVIEW